MIAGEADPLSPVAVGEFLRDRMPAAILQVVSGGTHAMALEEPDRIAALMGPFLRSVVR